MKFAPLLLLFCLSCSPILAAPTSETPVPVNAATPSLLPLSFVAGDLTITPIQAGFDYARRVFPGDPSIDLTPIFACTFQVSGAKTLDSGIGSRLVLRRIVGPQGEYVATFSGTAIGVQDQPDNFGFYNAQVDPRWETIDFDLDVLTAPQKSTSGKITLENIAAPASGSETFINRKFVGDLGTQFNLVKIQRKESGEVVAVVHFQKPAAPADLELSGYRISSQGDTGSSGGGGGLSNGLSASGDNELTLSSDKKLKTFASLEIEISESAPSRADRSQVVRQRLRYPLQKLLAAQKIALLQPGEQWSVPVAVGRAQNEYAAIRVEADGYDYDSVAALKVWAQAAPDDTNRGIQWNVAGGLATFAPDGQTAPLSSVFPSRTSFWHSDMTPVQKGETVELRFIHLPKELLPKDSARAKAARYDLKIELEGRAVLPENYERTVELPTDKALVEAVDDEEHSLILRKIQRFSAPEELASYPDWIRGRWPHAGVALVFEANPLLVGGDFEARAFDAEDDAGRALKLGTLMEETIYNADLTQADSKLRASKFYTLIVSQPAADARSFKVWLNTIEKAGNPTKTTLEIKDVAIAKSP